MTIYCQIEKPTDCAACRSVWGVQFRERRDEFARDWHRHGIHTAGALRGLLIGVPTNYWLDFGVLVAAAVAGICMAGAAIGRLAR